MKNKDLPLPDWAFQIPNLEHVPKGASSWVDNIFTSHITPLLPSSESPIGQRKCFSTQNSGDPLKAAIAHIVYESQLVQASFPGETATHILTFLGEENRIAVKMASIGPVPGKVS